MKKWIISFVLVSIYALLVTPLAYESARRHIINWALEQPEAGNMVDIGYTNEQRDEITRAINSLPSLGK